MCIGGFKSAYSLDKLYPHSNPDFTVSYVSDIDSAQENSKAVSLKMKDQIFDRDIQIGCCGFQLYLT